MNKKAVTFVGIGIAIVAICFITFLFQNNGSNKTSWQEQYDLGVRYLTEGNYDEAIIAFTAAIEIDPKQAEIYIKMADAYLAIDRYQNALSVLEKGLEIVGDNEVLNKKLTDLSIPQSLDGYPMSERIDYDGGYEIQYFNEYGFLVKSEQYDFADAFDGEVVWTYDADGRVKTRTNTRADGFAAVCTYDSDGRPHNEVTYDPVFNWTVTCSYEYTQGSSDVTIHFTLAGEDGSMNSSRSYTMQDTTHYVEVKGFNNKAGITHIAEYEMDGHNVRSVRFNNDGSIKSTEGMS